VKDEGTTLDSRFYRIEFNPETGGIKSIRDKELERELLDPKAPYGANQYVYAQGGNGTRIVANPKGPEPQIKISTSGKAKLRYIRHPGVREMMMISTSGTLAPVIVSSVILWENIKRIDIFNFVNKTLTYDKEGVYFTFPFAADNPTFRYEVPAGIVNANKDMLPGACLDWFTVQHFVEIESKDATIVWATPDAPLVCFQDINRGRWQTSLPLKTGHLYTYVMNNYWHTNYQAGQGGDHHFRFAITSRAKSDRTASVRFGWESSSPLLAVAVEANPRGKLPGTASLVSIAESNVVVIGMKRSETGTGLVVRLWEVEGRPTTTHVKLDPCLRVTKATACNLVEVPGEALKIQDSTIAVPIKGSGLATVLVE
jgi:alpha-mannosidase